MSDNKRKEIDTQDESNATSSKDSPSDTPAPTSSTDNNKKMRSSSPSDEKKDGDTGNASTAQPSDADDTLSLVKEMTPANIEAIHGSIKELRQVNFAEDLLKLYNENENYEWLDKKVLYDGPVPVNVRDLLRQMKEAIPGLEPDSLPNEDTPEIYKLVVDNIAGLEVLLVAIRYGEHGGEGLVNVFYDAKTFKPLLMHDPEVSGMHTDFNTPMEDFLRSQLDLIWDMFDG